GIAILKVMVEPTAMSASTWNKTPPAEMSSVSAVSMDASRVFSAIGRRIGKRTALRSSCMRHLSSRDDLLYIQASCLRKLPKSIGSGLLLLLLVVVCELEFCDLSKIEIAHLHCRHHHVKRLFPARPKRHAHLIHIIQEMNESLIEAEIANPTFDLAILDQECAITRHSGKHLFVRLY